MGLDNFSEYFILLVEAYWLRLSLFDLPHYWLTFKVFLIELYKRFVINLLLSSLKFYPPFRVFPTVAVEFFNKLLIRFLDCLS